MSKKPQFEVYQTSNKRYQWRLRHTNRKTLAQGRPMGFQSIKGATDAMKLGISMMTLGSVKRSVYGPPEIVIMGKQVEWTPNYPIPMVES